MSDSTGPAITIEPPSRIVGVPEGAEPSEEMLRALFETTVNGALDSNASDIHLESAKDGVRLRYRIDGVLYTIESMPPTCLPLIQTCKEAAGLDVEERGLPQDGRMGYSHQGKKVALRVSTSPFIFGEKVVMRVLDSSNLTLDPALLDYSEQQLETINAMLGAPYGLIVAAGPTGSGKTTTLYMMLEKLNTDRDNIVTVEDPVEFAFPGINQLQVRDDRGLDFAAAIRSFLRQDPDVIMVGEMRDVETMELTMKAALTGHLVLTQFHTSDTISTVSRMIKTGIEPILVGSALLGVVAQRLARRICKHCKTTETFSPRVLSDVGVPPDMAESTEFFRGKGCEHCFNTGYRGRTAIYEILHVSPAVRELIKENAASEQLRAAAEAEGMVNLRDSGLLKAYQGVTTVEEVVRVTPR